MRHDTWIMDEIQDLEGGDTLDGSLCPTNVIGVIGVDESGRIVFDWNAEGPVYSSNGAVTMRLLLSKSNKIF